jgi:hypothetical protein
MNREVIPAATSIFPRVPLGIAVAGRTEDGLGMKSRLCAQ